tara:strand:+ start:178 stop:678 length:501 start_codon:yes stop_codon:yes gene_type:complete
MWIVLKYRKSEFSFLRQDFGKVLGGLPLIFRPKFKYQKLVRNKLHFLEKDVLDDYLICYHEKFQDSKVMAILKNLRGLKYLLANFKTNQKEIVNFINYCKKNQDEHGYIKQSFFEFSNMSKGKFLSGPFTNMIFSVIENQKHRLKILVGKVTTTITKNSNYLYCPV